MALQIKPYALVIPAGTAIATPLTFVTDVSPYIVSAVSVVVPDGPNGAVGFRFTSGGLAMVPASATDWIVASGETLEWGMAGQVESGAWQVVAYNTGNYPHTIYVRYFLDLIARAAAAAPPTFLAPADIQGTADGLIAGSLPEPTA